MYIFHFSTYQYRELVRKQFILKTYKYFCWNAATSKSEIRFSIYVEFSSFIDSRKNVERRKTQIRSAGNLGRIHFLSKFSQSAVRDIILHNRDRLFSVPQNIQTFVDEGKQASSWSVAAAIFKNNSEKNMEK